MVVFLIASNLCNNQMFCFCNNRFKDNRKEYKTIKQKAGETSKSQVVEKLQMETHESTLAPNPTTIAASTVETDLV